MNEITLREYELCFSNLPPSFHGKRLVFISDLHGKKYGEENEGLCSLLRKAKPDYLLIGGDMVVGGKRGKEASLSIFSALSFLKKIRGEFPIFHALGNHEEKLSEDLFEKYVSGLRRLRVRLLDNEKACILSEEGEKIFLYGLSLGRMYYPKLKRLRLPLIEVERRLGKREGFSILLAHSPFYFKTYRQWGADLVLSGHLHGGIMRLPFLGGVLGPDFIPFPKYSGGFYKEEGKQMIVSCGLGSHTIPLRIFNPPELTIIDLRTDVKKYGN